MTDSPDARLCQSTNPNTVPIMMAEAASRPSCPNGASNLVRGGATLFDTERRLDKSANSDHRMGTSFWQRGEAPPTRPKAASAGFHVLTAEHFAPWGRGQWKAMPHANITACTWSRAGPAGFESGFPRCGYWQSLGK